MFRDHTQPAPVSFRSTQAMGSRQAYLALRMVILGVALIGGIGLIVHGRASFGVLVIGLALLRAAMVLGFVGNRRRRF
jgi:hypothetical protein